MPSRPAGGDALVHSRRDRLAAVRAAERTGDPTLTARIIGAYDVPALWSRDDDPGQSRAVVAAAERTLTALGPEGPADLRARLLATVAVQSRSADLSATELERARQAARQAEEPARDLPDPALLAFALNGVSCSRSSARGSRRYGTVPAPRSSTWPTGTTCPRRPRRRRLARPRGRPDRRHHGSTPSSPSSPRGSGPGP